MTVRRQVRESGTITAPSTPGVFPIRLITEGEGSSGVYSADLLENHGEAFSGRPMFMNHPKDPNKPWERDVLTAAARLGEIRVGETEDGQRALYSEATVRKEYVDFVQEFADVIGVSIFIEAAGKEENGKFLVESFNAADPYSSVDFVVAAGRGGRVERAQEAYRAIEASIGTPSGETPAVTSAQEQEEGQMEKEILEALTGLKASFDTFVAESKSAAEAEATARAEAVSVEQAVKTAVAEYDEKAKAINDAELLPSQTAALLESARLGEDITVALESAKKIVEEAKTLAEASGTVIVGGRVVEGAITDASALIPRNW